jgi:signal transduction histidine kinase
MLAELVLSVSALLQFTAAFCALRLIKVTGKQYSWILISSALFLMGVRQLIPLYYSIVAFAGYSVNMTDESIGLILSLLMLLAVIRIGPIFAERKQIQERLQQYSQELEKTVKARTRELEEANSRLLSAKRLAAIGELAGMVGHDLRNPLTGIKNAVYFLKSKGASISEVDRKAMLEIIEKGIAHSDKIINNLRDYAAEMHVDLKECRPRKLLAEALSMAKIPEKVKTVNNIPSELTIKMDPNKIMQVFSNLVRNAIDAMPDGGTLTVDCRQVDSNIEISFADTGVGISEEILPKIFSPLFTTKAQGMGFGLAISKRIVEAHQGRITVQSVKGKGSTFTVTIPRKPVLKDEDETKWINLPESLLMTTK